MSILSIAAHQLVNGLVLGSFYALVAFGYTMVFGVIKLLNFAHGDLYMVGGFVGFLALSAISGVVGGGWPGIFVAMLLSMLAVGCLGVVIERIAYHPDACGAATVHSDHGARGVAGAAEHRAYADQRTVHGLSLAISASAAINLGNLFITYNQMVLAGTAARADGRRSRSSSSVPSMAARCARSRSTRTCAS